VAAPLSQVGSVRADHVEPRFVEKLTKSRCARALVLRVWIAVGFNADDPLNHGVNNRSGNRSFPLRIRWPISVVPTKPAETKSRQGHAHDDQTPKYPTAARHGSRVRRHRETRVLSHARDAYGILTFIRSVAINVNSAARLRKWYRLSIPLASLGAGARSASSKHACLPSLRDP